MIETRLLLALICPRCRAVLARHATRATPGTLPDVAGIEYALFSHASRWYGWDGSSCRDCRARPSPGEGERPLT